MNSELWHSALCECLADWPSPEPRAPSARRRRHQRHHGDRWSMVSLSTWDSGTAPAFTSSRPVHRYRETPTVFAFLALPRPSSPFPALPRGTSPRHLRTATCRKGAPVGTQASATTAASGSAANSPCEAATTTPDLFRPLFLARVLSFFFGF